MCGINGVLLTAGPAIGPETVRARIAAMNRRLVHRGPDDEGLWQDPDAGIAFGHRRLAINDLSPLGHQPMVSASGRLVLALNGEIYNFRTLRRDLEQRGRTLRGRSDTEVLLELLALYGVEATLQRVQGMYAFALWDRDERRLTLVRDRLGKKPLYLAQRGGALVFASELKALAAWPGPSPALDPRAVAGYLREGHIAAPACIYTQPIALAQVGGARHAHAPQPRPGLWRQPTKQCPARAAQRRRQAARGLACGEGLPVARISAEQLVAAIAGQGHGDRGAGVPRDQQVRHQCEVRHRLVEHRG